MFRAPILFAAVIAMPALAQTAETPSSFVTKAGASDLYEKQSSQLVSKSTQNPDIRRFAQDMITDHGKTTATVTAAAKQAGLPAKPPKLNATQTANMKALTSAQGAARDRLYLQQQGTSHQQALALHQGYSQAGTEPHLKAAATKAVPIVQHHIQMLGQIKQM